VREHSPPAGVAARSFHRCEWSLDRPWQQAKAEFCCIEIDEVTVAFGPPT
jgi:hypothetical protein